MALDIRQFSGRFAVRRMCGADVPTIYAMTSRNVQYYAHCGRPNTAADVEEDLRVTPPGKSLDDKYYVGYYDGARLAAVLDLIAGYPDERTAYIGFFMLNVDDQGRGTGNAMVEALCAYLRQAGFEAVRLGFERDIPQSSHFLMKNGFKPVGQVEREGGVIVVAQRPL